MKRILFVLIAAVAMAGTANASSLTLEGPGVVNVGDTFTVTLSADYDGGVNPSLFVGLVPNDPSLVSFTDDVVQTPLTAAGGFITLAQSGTPCLRSDGQCLLVNQANVNAGLANDAFSGVLSTFTATAVAQGTLVLTSGPTSTFGDALDNGPISLSVEIVPEPGTALLMGLGLIGLAVAGRRQS